MPSVCSMRVAALVFTFLSAQATAAAFNSSLGTQQVSDHANWVSEPMKNCSDDTCKGTSKPFGQFGTCDDEIELCQSICGAKEEACDANNCQGDGRVCTAGKYKGCPCGQPKCNNHDLASCDQNNCQGVFDASLLRVSTANEFGIIGVCTAGEYKGCGCLASLNMDIQGRCDSPECRGRNGLHGVAGTCEASGLTQGLNCKSVCGDRDWPCNDGECKGGYNSTLGKMVCTAGPYLGCSCGSACNNNDEGHQACDANGCQGVNDPNGGLGNCTAGEFARCPCKSICTPPESCGEHGCDGRPSPKVATGFGICSKGQFAGCKCRLS